MHTKSQHAGESEKHLREAFEKARINAASGQRTVLFFDDLESLAPKRDANRPHEARVVAQLLTLLDGAASDAGRPPTSPPYNIARPTGTLGSIAWSHVRRSIGCLQMHKAI